ncbi:MAG: hypothetical protein LC790_19195 [Actinobacteria bacterium]|nr:hypothetical protein [Actinomycetota bacterium]
MNVCAGPVRREAAKPPTLTPGRASKLGDEELHELRTRLTAWSPAAPFKDLITGDDKQYTLHGPASAWLFFAPAAEMTVTDEQWAQLATSPMIHTEHSEWLRRQASVLRMMRALELMTDMRATAWLRLLDCCPAPPPAFVVNACAVSVKSDADTPRADDLPHA